MRRVLLGILFYFGGIVLLSAVVAPWAFWVWDGFFPGEEPFRRVFNRVLMVTALLLLWPLARYWGIRSWSELGLRDRGQLPKEWLRWMGWGVLSVGLLFLMQMWMGQREWKGTGELGQFVEFFASAGAVAVLEEILFRGLFFLVLLRMWPGKAWWVGGVTCLFFATTHYLKAENPPGEVVWWTGWEAWGGMLMELGNLEMLALRWVTLLLVGGVLCALVYRQGHLWGCMGLHMGWVMGLKSLNHVTEWRGGAGSWWFQADVLSGLSAELLLLAMLLMVLWPGWGKSGGKAG
ncbi:MAG: CPBP family intramembrane metalloprotease [Blastochloris sp.]|nr:CPBP family intramembrane metalloprotease [Blastochloris sp.]